MGRGSLGKLARMTVITSNARAEPTTHTPGDVPRGGGWGAHLSLISHSLDTVIVHTVQWGGEGRRSPDMEQGCKGARALGVE